ncbi:hypothetical protein ABIE33_000579 [Ensifer sp. 4252]
MTRAPRHQIDFAALAVWGEVIAMPVVGETETG